MNRTRGTVFSLAAMSLTFFAAPALADLAEHGSLPAIQNEGGYQAGAVNTIDGTAVFASSNAPIAASNASLVSVFTLEDPNVINSIFSYKVAFSPFRNFRDLTVAVFDPTTGCGFFTSNSRPSGIEKIPLTSQARSSFAASSTTLQAGQDSVGSGVVDPVNQFGYFGTQTSPSMIVKVDLTNLAVVSSITLPAGLEFLTAAVIDSQNGFAYFGSSTTPGAVAKIRLSNFTLVSTVTFNSGEGGVASAVIDLQHQFAYFGTHDSPGKVVKMQLSTFLRDSSLTLKSGENDLTSAVFDAATGRAYFGTNTSPGIVVQVTGSNLSENRSLPLRVGENFLRSGVIDANGFAYFGTFTTPGKVIQVDLLAGPPEILLEPVEIFIHAGEVAAFSINAGGRSLAFQWQRDGVDIPGATSAAYSFKAVVTDDGAAFRCVLTGANGLSAISRSVLLTILPVIRAFPNPWRSDRHTGVPITFDGLLPNSTVKIFNLAAHWVRTLPPAAGSATWDRTNDAGQTVASGYYFFLITTGKDKQTVHGKLAIIK